ncbi:MAG: Superoxide dismutase [Cu-Zn] [Paramarteilia canceri]
MSLKSLKAVCVLESERENKALATLTQVALDTDSATEKLAVDFHILIPAKMAYSLKCSASSKKRGIAILKRGDLSSNPYYETERFNPFKEYHGSLNSKVRKLGDLGNLDFTHWSKGTDFQYRFRAYGISLDWSDGFTRCVLGRSLVITSQEDDLGLEGSKESSMNGNSGKIYAVGVIGYKE